VYAVVVVYVIYVIYHVPGHVFRLHSFEFQGAHIDIDIDILRRRRRRDGDAFDRREYIIIIIITPSSSTSLSLSLFLLLFALASALKSYGTAVSTDVNASLSANNAAFIALVSTMGLADSIFVIVCCELVCCGGGGYEGGGYIGGFELLLLLLLSMFCHGLVLLSVCGGVGDGLGAIEIPPFIETTSSGSGSNVASGLCGVMSMFKLRGGSVNGCCSVYW